MARNKSTEDLVQQITDLHIAGKQIPDELLSELAEEYKATLPYNKAKFENKYTKVSVPGTKSSVLGEGGNAVAFMVKSVETSEIYALKYLKVLKPEKKARFLEEIDIVSSTHQKIAGVLPLCDCNREAFWYTMPYAEPVLNHIVAKNDNIQAIVLDYLKLIQTFIDLHNIGIAHRDIKPDNIYFYNDRYYIGDFGLVDYPDKDHQFTKSDQGIGAIFTIAPEMKRDPLHVKDARKADVYSLAKTLWMLITRDEKGFDGQYDYCNGQYALRLQDRFRYTHLAELELLLMDCTKDNPDERPTIEEVYGRLILWLKVCENRDWSAASDWRFLNRLLFKNGTPRSVTWSDIKIIIDVLHHICWLPTRNHVMFSTGGGLDMTDVTFAAEEGCICISFGKLQTSIVKPKALHYETFGKDSSWNYLMLELDTMDPIFELPEEEEDELLDEDYPGHYVSATDFNYGVYSYEGGVPLPPTARLVCRHTRGKLLIVLGSGHYNLITETYDGRHSACSIAEFREYIEGLVKVSHTPNISQDEIDKAIRKVTKPDEVEWTDNRDNEKLAPEHFLINHIADWNFSDLLPQNREINPAMIYSAEVSFSYIYSFVPQKEIYWILEDGQIEKESDSQKPYFFASRNDMINCCRAIRNKVLEDIKALGYSGLNAFDCLSFSPHLKLCSKPTHLFSREEIEKLMRNADDRNWNQLVIDEHGYAHMIQERGMASYYPVSHEAWEPGNNYVGKYSKLSDLDSAYTDSLDCWLVFLETGVRQYCDYSRHVNIEGTIEKILKYMD